MLVLTNKKETKKASIFDRILTFFGIKKVSNHVLSFEETLASYLDSNGKQFLSNEEIVDLIKNCQKSGTSGEPIENYKEKLLHTVEANPGLFQ